MSWEELVDLDGPEGEQGERGDRGSRWTAGNGAPSSPPAQLYDWYLDGASSDIYCYQPT